MARISEQVLAGLARPQMAQGMFDLDKYRARKPVVYPTDPVSIPIWQGQGPWLFDLQADAQEAYDISMRKPAIAAELKAVMDAKNAEMAANPRGWK